MVASISLGIRQGGTEAAGADDAVVGVGVDDIAVAISAISAVSVSFLELEVGLEPKKIWTLREVSYIYVGPVCFSPKQLVSFYVPLPLSRDLFLQIVEKTKL